MTAVEMHQQFELLYNNIISNQAPGLNSYEISQFLTKAQLEKLKNYFNPKSNTLKEGLDDSKKRQLDFSNIITTVEVSKLPNPTVFLEDVAWVYKVPSNTLMILNEYLTVPNNRDYRDLHITSINYDEYTRRKQRYYQKPIKYESWKLVIDHAIIDDVPYDIVELMPNVSKDLGYIYKLRYLRMPVPIIIEDLSSLGLTIDGVSSVSNCELDVEIHDEIVQRAVEMAKAAYIQGDLKSSIEIGNRSE